MKDSIYVNRSVSACLKEATAMAFSHLKTILFTTWLPLLLVSISFTGILLSFTPNKQIYDLGNANIWLSLLFLVAMYILLFVSWLWTAAKAFAIVNGEKTKNNLKRCIAPIIVLVAFSLAVKSCLTGAIYETVNKWLTTFNMSEQATSGLAHSIDFSHSHRCSPAFAAALCVYPLYIGTKRRFSQRLQIRL